MAQHQRTPRLAIALLTVLTLLFALFPGLPEPAAAAELVSLSKSDFVIGYPPTAVTLSGSDAFKFKSDTRVYLYNANNSDTRAVQGVQVIDSKTLTFTLQPGLSAGKYSLLVMSYTQTTIPLTILTSYDPTNVTITPGANADIRVDWTDPNALDINDIVIQYSLIDQNSYVPVHVPRGVGTYTIKNLQHKKAYKFMIYSTKLDNTKSPGVTLTNGGAGYTAVDSTPPGDITNLAVKAVPNGFQLNWTDPVNPDYPNNPALSDLSLITVQYAEHGTSNWSEGFVVAKGVQTATLTPMNTAKRYDFRFTKLDVNGNWNYQIDTHNGYGYAGDTDPPAEVTSLHVSTGSDTSASITWYDPQTTDFHHVNVYLKSPLSTDWKFIGRADKDLQTFQLNGLAPGIDYTLKATTVDQVGNESNGSITGVFRTATLSDRNDLTNVEIKQEVSGGLVMTWPSDNVSTVDFNRFKMYYASMTATDPKDFKPTEFSNKGAKTASLRDMPRGLYKLDMRLVDSFGLMQSLQMYNNSGAGYYVSGNGTNLPADVQNVKVLGTDGINLDLTWDASSTTGTHLQVYVAERSQNPSWRLLGKVDVRNQRFTATGLSSAKDYFFKLVVLDANRNLESPGVIYDNSGYGYNVIGGDRYPPQEVTNASATVNMNSLVVSYIEPPDADFNLVNIYAKKLNSNDAVNPVPVTRGSNGTTIRDLVPGQAYTLRITTVDNSGNESAGITLNNNGAGYLIAGVGQATNEVRGAYAIPNFNQLTVRFQDPTITDYARTLVAIKKVSDATYTNEVSLSKGQNEQVFSGLDSNQAYMVRLITVTSSGKQSTGIYLGGTNGISMQPISSVSNARVTPGTNRLNVTWSDPSSTVPTGIAVEVMPMGRSVWSEPQIVRPGTGALVFNGLSGSQPYKVRITTLRNEIGSPSVILDGSSYGSGPGYTPRDTAIAAAPSHILSGNAGDTQVVSIIGRNTRFNSLSSTDVTLYGADGSAITDAIKSTTSSGSTRIDVRLSRNLVPGTYTLQVRSNEDGVLATSITVQNTAPQPEITSLSSTAANYGYGTFSMTINGDGFNSASKVVIDNGSPISASSNDSKTLTFSMPTGLQPGTHKITVSTNGVSTAPMIFTVNAFKSQVTMLSIPSVRNGIFRGECSVSNLDLNPRTAKVILIIRRNDQFVEERETTVTFNGYETKKVKVDFGGANTPYSIGPTQTISVQAFIVDDSSLTPLADPTVSYTTLNL